MCLSLRALYSFLAEPFSFFSCFYLFQEKVFCKFMDLELLEKGLEYTKKKKKWVLVLGALGFTGYGAYRVYNLPSVVKKRQRLSRLVPALFSLAEMVSDSADAVGILSKELKQFLGSDSDQIPQSLKQVSKIAKSDDFSESLSTITGALTVGILRGYRNESIENGECGPAFSDRVIDKLFSDAGSGFVSIVVGSFTKNLAMGLYSEWQHSRGSNFDNSTNQNIPNWVDIACEDKCRELIGECIQLFVTTAVGVYLDKTMNINTYDQILSGLTNPKHEAQVKDMLVSVCNGAVESFIRTSNDVWIMNSKHNSTYSKIEFEDGFSVRDEKSSIRAKLIPTKRFTDKIQQNGWARKMTTTLAMPSNRKLVLDMTKTVTFQTVRSFLDFLLEKLSECMRRGVDVVHQDVVDRGVEAMRHMSGKSSAVATLCITLCLNILNSPWILAPY